MMEKKNIDTYEKVRPQLLGLAYRLLGSVAEAEDAVQDTFLKWQAVDKSVIRNGEAWLTTCCTNLSLDMLKSARRSRTSYIGPWLPEPLHTKTERNAEEDLVLNSSLTTAFLFLLERLTPKERAAYLLHEIFDYPYEDISKTLGIQAVACRKLVSRAKKFVGQDKVRNTPTAEQQEKLLDAFQLALKTGSSQSLGTLLSEGAELRADSGGKVIAVREVLSGQETVLSFIVETLRYAWNDLQVEISEINGTLGLNLNEDGEIVASISFGYDQDGALDNIFIMRNPEKLNRLESVNLHNSTNGALILQ